MRVLDLESQVEVLDRLRLITRFGSSIVSVTGVEGSGKSWLAQRYLENWVPEKNQSLLMCHSTQSDAQHREIILKQLVPNELYNENNALLDSFEHLLGETRCDLVIVVDDAELLSPTILQELYLLVGASTSSAYWAINVVLFSSNPLINNALEKVSASFETKPIEIEIEPLTEGEAETFLHRQIFSVITDPKKQSKIARRAKKCPPHPGALMELAKDKSEKKVIIQSIVASPLNIALIVMLILLLLAGGYIWLLSGDKSSARKSDAEQAEMIDELMQGSLATKTLSDATDNSDGETRTRRVVIDENGNEVIVDSNLVYDSDSLPPEVSTNLMSVGTADDNKNRVVVPDQVVDALIDEQPNADTSIIDNALVDAKNQPVSLVISDDLLEPKPSVNVDETIVESGTQVEEEEPQLLITFSYARDELKAVPNRHYTVQLGAMRSLQDVQEFINLHDLDGQVRIYPTIRSEAEWYIITYRDYDTIQKARDAIKNLPSSLQSIGAWAKSMTQVHREIDREK